jgi:hypothetical protein
MPRKSSASRKIRAKAAKGGIEFTFKFTVVRCWVRLNLYLKGNDKLRLQNAFLNEDEFFTEFLEQFFKDGDFRCNEGSYFDLSDDPTRWLNLDILWDRRSLRGVYNLLMDDPLDEIAKFEEWVNTKLKPLLALLSEPYPWKKVAIEKTIVTSDEGHAKIEIL